MAKHSIIDEEETTEIDLSPMIDCIFILLIFFIVTTVFVEEKGLQVNKPDAAAPTTLDHKPSVTLEITAQNKVLFHHQEIGLGELAARVRGEVKSPETPVVIRANAKSKHGTFVAVWDAARRAGAQKLTFTTVD
jgi:biopolymer transport protein ExbD